MQPIHELLSRIRWDAEFGKGRFEIAYEDHQLPKPVRVALDAIQLSEHDHFMFSTLSPLGEEIAVPLHRIREVYKDGRLIWCRRAH
jgi:uncharacterized protein (UPF0248 family)